MLTCCNTIQNIHFISYLGRSKISQNHGGVTGAAEILLFSRSFWHRKSVMGTQTPKINIKHALERPVWQENRFIKTSQWKVTECPFIDKDQHPATCVTAAHTPKHPHKPYSHSHPLKEFQISLAICPQYHDTTALLSFHTSSFWLEPKIHCEQSVIQRREPQPVVCLTVDNRRLEETKENLIRNTAGPSQGH